MRVFFCVFLSVCVCVCARKLLVSGFGGWAFFSGGFLFVCHMDES